MRKYLNFSNAIAFIALFVAMGGTVYAAGKLSGAQIKPNSLPGNRVVAGSITGKQVKLGSLTGKQIKAGSLTGQQVVGSSLTGVSASSLATVQYASVTVGLPEAGVSARASCPGGTKVIGGGATVANVDAGEAFINDSGPTADRTGWTAHGRAFVVGRTMTVTAICTPVVSASG